MDGQQVLAVELKCLKKTKDKSCCEKQKFQVALARR
jgi:hypothetical protein